jgi:hypothetical protein
LQWRASSRRTIRGVVSDISKEVSMKTIKLAPIAAAVVAMTLAACAQQPRRDMGAEPPPPARERRDPPVEPIRATAPAAAPTPSAAAAAPSGRDAAPAVADPLAPIGVVACDAYLARYRSCHATIGAVQPDMIDERRTRLHGNLLARANDPAQRDGLESMCEGLQETMDEALDGRECGTPATRSGTDFYVE